MNAQVRFEPGERIYCCTHNATGVFMHDAAEPGKAWVWFDGDSIHSDTWVNRVGLRRESDVTGVVR